MNDDIQSDGTEGSEVAPDVETNPPPEANVDGRSYVDQLLGDDMPAWMEAARRAADGGPIQVTREQIEAMPMEAQSYLYNVRRELEEARQAGQEQMASMEAREADLRDRERALLRERTSIQTGMADALRTFVESKIRPLAEGDQPDPDSPAGREAEVQRYAYGVLQGFIDQIGEFEGQRVKQMRDAEAQHQASLRETAMRAFIRENLDGDGPLNDREVVAEFADLVKRGFDRPDALERAVAIVGARRGDDDDRIVKRIEARRRTMRGQGGSERIPPTPSTNVDDRMRFYERYPEAEARDIAAALKLPRGL